MFCTLLFVKNGLELSFYSEMLEVKVWSLLLQYVILDLDAGGAPMAASLGPQV